MECALAQSSALWSGLYGCMDDWGLGFWGGSAGLGFRV